MAISTITNYSGQVPLRDGSQTKTQFSDNTGDILSFIPPMIDDWNTSITETNAVFVEIEEFKDDAEASAIASEASRQAADAASNYKGEWSALAGALAKPATVSNNGAFWALNNSLANVALSEPEPGNADWTFVSGTRWVTPFTASATLPANSMCTIIATSAAADMELDTFSQNDFFVLMNSSASTQTVRLMNPSYTIRSVNATALPGDNIPLAPGETMQLVAISASILEVVQK